MEIEEPEADKNKQGCCSCSDGGGKSAAFEEEPDYGEGYSYEPEFDGRPTKRRRCTDVACLALFGAFLGAWGFVGYTAYTQGDVNKVIYPTDTAGRICGQGSLADHPHLLFFDVTRCLNPAVLSLGCPTTQVCVRECPKERYSPLGDLAVHREESVKEKMRPFCVQMSDSEWDASSARDLIEGDKCPTWWLPSNPVLGRCVPQVTSSEDSRSKMNETVFDEKETSNGKQVRRGEVSGAVSALGAFLQLRDLGERVFSDLSDTWWMIGVALVGAAFVSFLWIVLMRFATGLMVWTSLGLVVAVFGGLFGFSLYKYIQIKDLPSSQGNVFQINFTPDYGKDFLNLAQTWLAFSVILGILFLVVALVLIVLRKRIALAVELIQESSKAVAHMPATLLWPLVPFLLHVLVALFFAGVALFLSSAGTAEYNVTAPSADVEHVNVSMSLSELASLRSSQLTSCATDCQNPSTSEEYRIGDACDPAEFNKTCSACAEVRCQFTKYTRAASWMQWFNLFGLYWGMFFVSALSEMVLAGAFAQWYWTFRKEEAPCCVLHASLFNAVVFHLGTLAFGSCIIAVVRMIRTVLSYVEKKLKGYNNELTRCLICCCKCCLWCLERFMRFVNRNAYIMCAIKSTHFCASAKDAFSLIMRNVARVTVLNGVVSFLLFLAQVVIVAGVGALSFFVFAGRIAELRDVVVNRNSFSAETPKPKQDPCRKPKFRPKPKQPVSADYLISAIVFLTEMCCLSRLIKPKQGISAETGCFG